MLIVDRHRGASEHEGVDGKGNDSMPRIGGSKVEAEPTLYHFNGTGWIHAGGCGEGQAPTKVNEDFDLESDTTTRLMKEWWQLRALPVVVQ